VRRSQDAALDVRQPRIPTACAPGLDWRWIGLQADDAGIAVVGDTSLGGRQSARRGSLLSSSSSSEEVLNCVHGHVHAISEAGPKSRVLSSSQSQPRLQSPALLLVATISPVLFLTHDTTVPHLQPCTHGARVTALTNGGE
jgi:hypothetical protein